MIKMTNLARTRRLVLSIMLISLSLLSVGDVAVRQGFASTVTQTLMTTLTQYITSTISITSTRYYTATSTIFSTATNTQVSYTTATSTSTQTVDSRSASTVLTPTTTSTTIQRSKTAKVVVTLDYNTESSFIHIPVAGLSIPLPTKQLKWILNEVRATVTITNVGDSAAKFVSIGFVSGSSSIATNVEGDLTWSGDLDLGQSARFYSVWLISRCMPFTITVDGSYRDLQGNSYRVERKQATVGASDFILFEADGGWSKVSLCPETVQYAKQRLGNAGIVVLSVLIWTMVAEKIVSIIDGEDLIDKANSQLWDTFMDLLGKGANLGADIAFALGLSTEVWNLNSGAKNGKCPLWNCVVFPGDKTMEYWIVWWSAPDIASAIIHDVVDRLTSGGSSGTAPVSILSELGHSGQAYTYVPPTSWNSVEFAINDGGSAESKDASYILADTQLLNYLSNYFAQTSNLQSRSTSSFIDAQVQSIREESGANVTGTSIASRVYSEGQLFILEQTWKLSSFASKGFLEWRLDFSGVPTTLGSQGNLSIVLPKDAEVVSVSPFEDARIYTGNQIDLVYTGPRENLAPVIRYRTYFDRIIMYAIPVLVGIFAALIVGVYVVRSRRRRTQSALMQVGRACPRCGTLNRPGAVFCTKDGTRLIPKQIGVPGVKVCPTCGFANRPNARFCVRDRTRLPLTMSKPTATSQVTVVCAKCGTNNKPGASFCRKCRAILR